MTEVETGGTTADAVPRPAVWRRGLRMVLLVTCGIALAGVSALAVVRLAGLDAGTFLALPIAVLPCAAVGTVAVLLILLALKSRWLTPLAVVLVVVELVWLVPRFVPDGTDITAGAPRLRVATSNAYVGRIDPKAIVELVRSEKVDVLAAEELTSAAARALDEAGMRELMPYRELHPEVDSSIYSRLPLSNGGLVGRPTVWPETTAEVTVSGRTVRLVAVHTYYPLGDPHRWTADMEALRDETGKDVVLLGDFNATLDHAPMRALLDAGMVDAHAELGRGWAPTWPVIDWPLPPLAQIDHVLHGGGLAAVSVSEHTLPGTDHRAVVAELALLG